MKAKATPVQNKKILIAVLFAVLMVSSGLSVLADVPAHDAKGNMVTPYEGAGSTDFSFTYLYEGMGRETGATETVTVSPTSLDLGQTIELTSTSSPTVTSSKTTTYYYNGASSSSAVWTPSATGTFDVGEKVTTSVGTYGTTDGTTVTVVSDPSVTISSSASTVDSGQTVTLTASPSGGSGSYTYQWYENSTAISGATSSTYVFNPTYTASYFVIITDSYGDSATSNTVTVTVDSDVSLSLSSSRSTSDIGQDISFTTTASGGSGTYSSYSYVLYDGTSTSDSQLTSGTTSSFSYTFASAGQFLLDYSVTDSNGYTKTASLTQIVNTDPSVSISSSQNPTDVGNSVTFTASPSGGTTPYTYAWTIDGTSYSTQDVTTSFSSSGSYTVDLTLTDAAGYSVSTSLVETVSSDPTVSASSNVSSADVGYPIEFSSSPSGGTGPYTYSWTIGGTQVSTSQDFSYSFSTAGTYTVDVTVTDSLGETYSSSVSVTINNNPSVTVSSSQNPTDIGDSVTFTASESGGTGTISYSWTVNGASEGSGSTLDYTFSSSGSYKITMTVTDSDGHTSSYSLTETVFSDPSVSISSSQNPTDVGNTVTFKASSSDGSGSYTYQWYLNSAAVSGATSSTYATSFSSTGTEEIYVVIHDSVGNSAQSSTLDETVNPDPSVTVSSSQNPTDVGNTVTFTASPSGGSGGYNYEWYVNGVGITEYPITITGSPSGTGTYQQEFTISNPSQYGINPSGSNFQIAYPNGTPAYSWIQSINSTSLIVWSKLYNGTSQVELQVFPSFVNLLSATGYIGEETQYFNAKNVFPDAILFNGSSQGLTLVGGTQYNSITSSGLTVHIGNENGTFGVGVVLNRTFDYPVMEIADITTHLLTSNSGETAGLAISASTSYGIGYGVYNPYEASSISVMGTLPNGYYTPNTQYTVTSGTLTTLPETYTGIIGEGYTGTSGGFLTYVNGTFTYFTTGQNMYPSNYSVPEHVNFGIWNNAFNESISTPYIIVARSMTSMPTISIGSSSSTYTTVFNTSGTSNVYVVVHDSLGNSVQSSSITETVNPDPTVIISSSQNPTDIGNSVTFTASGSGGTPGYTYSWTVNGASQSSTSSELATSFSNAGSYYVNVTIKDANGNIASHSFQETVNPDPSVTITSSPNPTDAGVPVTISSSATGGTSPYNYTWEINSVIVFYGSSFSYTFSSAGTYAIELILRDANGNTAAATLNETVNEDPTATISAEYTTVDQGVNDTFTAEVSDGTYPFNYTWELGTDIVNYSSSFHMPLSTIGTNTLKLILRDSLNQYYNTSIAITVIEKPSVSVNGPDRTDINTKTTFVGNATYGTAPYDFYWFVNGVNVTSSSSGLYLTYSFTSTGTYNVSIKAVDAQGASAKSYLLVTVYARPTVSISWAVLEGDTGFTDTFVSSISGGSPSFAYSWRVGGNQVGTQQNLTYTFSSAGTVEVLLTVTDFAGNTAQAHENITVNPLPQVSISPQYTHIDHGIPDTFNSTVSYGTSSYNYTWEINGAVISHSPSFSYTFTSSGSYTVKLTVRDADGNTASSIRTITVNGPVIPAIFSTYKDIDIGTSISFDGGISGGTSPYNYTWEINGAVVSYGSSFLYAFNSSGIYTVILVVRDGFGQTGNASVSITVNQLPSASFTASRSSIDAGQSDSFFSSISGGTSTYTYIWEVDGSTVSNSQNLSYTFTSAGTYTITLEITDSLGKSSSYTMSITVNSPLSGYISIKYPVVDENITDSIAVNAANGTSPYTYSILIGGTVVSHSSSYSQFFTVSGTYEVTVYVNDSAGENIRLSASIVVRANPSVSIVSPTNKTDVNVLTSFRGILSGGTGSYAYTWLVAGRTFTNATLSFAFPSAGKFAVQLTVTDAFGREAIASINETVFPDPSATLVKPAYIVASEQTPLSVNISGGIAPFSVSWIFPGGEQFSGSNITYAFSSSGPNTFQVKVQDSSGYTDTQNFTLDVHLFVSIAANTTSGLGPLSVQFSSSVLGGSAYSYNWTFSPGHYSLEQNPQYVFPVGNYTVNFKVTSANGATGQKNISIESLPSPVTFNYSTNLNITQAFHFKAMPNWDAKGPYNMSWSFPDGQTLTGLNISYKFPVYDELNTVIAKFSYAGKTWTQNLIARMIPSKPIISFKPPSIIPTGTMLALNASASAPDSSSFSYSWVIDGSSYSGQDQLYYFNSPGNYTISVSVTDSLGASSSAARTIEVLPQGSNSSIAISYVKKTVGPMDYYTVEVQSTIGIIAVEALLGTTELSVTEINSTYTASGELAYFNITLDQANYPSGTYSLSISAFNNNTQSNHILVPFLVTSQYSSSSFNLGSIISFFGGFSNFLITILTLGGLVIAWASLRDSRNPDVIIEDGTGKKSKKIVLKGRTTK